MPESAHPCSRARVPGPGFESRTKLCSFRSDLSINCPQSYQVPICHQLWLKAEPDPMKIFSASIYFKIMYRFTLRFCLVSIQLGWKWSPDLRQSFRVLKFRRRVNWGWKCLYRAWPVSRVAAVITEGTEDLPIVPRQSIFIQRSPN